MKTLFTFIMIAALVTAADPVNAQCSGEVVQFRETFGAGTGNAALPSGRTNYLYNGATALQDGDYKLNSSSQGKPEWHNGPDHTGDLNRRMMVTNASFTPGEFYRDTVYSLSSTSHYAVYLYAMNVNTVGTCSPNPILPRLQLIVESYNPDGTFTELSSMVSEDFPQTATPTWVKISGLIYLPINVTAVRYRIINNATGGCGNDIAIDDITFSQCAPSILPLTGVALKGVSDGSSVSLNWMGRQDAETERYVVEKSSDGKNWKLFSNVRSAKQEVYGKYDIKDNEPFNGPTYYRVAAIALNGQSFYSNIIIIRPTVNSLKLNAYPNPFTQQVGLELLSDGSAGGSTIRLFDFRGRLLRTIPWNLKKGINSMSINGMDGLQSGIYLIDVIDRNSKILCQSRLVKK